MSAYQKAAEELRALREYDEARERERELSSEQALYLANQLESAWRKLADQGFFHGERLHLLRSVYALRSYAEMKNEQ